MDRILYHRTSAEDAAAIIASGRFLSRENTQTAFFSTRRDGQAVGYGTAIVEIHVPADRFDDEIGRFQEDQGWLDDEFPDGEEHWSIQVDAIAPEWIRSQR